MSAQVTRTELDRARCGTPGCTHESHRGLFLHGRCHPSAGAEVEYRFDGVLRIRCNRCKQAIVDVAVASPGIPGPNTALAVDQ